MGEISRKLAVVIGINQYQHGISALSTAVADATELSRLLTETYGYEVWSLFDQQANLDGLTQLLKQQLPHEIKPTDNDQLLFYFAGHGTALQSDQGPAGYVIPQDAKPEAPDMFLPMQELHKALTDLHCRHFLAIFDCCFAGTFRWASTRDILAVPEVVYKERFARYRDYPAWQVITSASYNQKALDIFLDNRGKSQQDKKHSPFAAALFDALRGEADLIQDGIITATEMYLYLRDRVEQISEDQQTPGLWPLEKHDRGEYIFLTDLFEKENLENAPSLSPENNPYRGLEAFEEAHGALFFGRDHLIRDLYDQVKDNSLTAVLGASGTGKSSLVKAGLIPYLKQAEFLKKKRILVEHPVQEKWHVLEPLRPGNDPLTGLAQTLLPISNDPITDDESKAIAIFHELVLKNTSSLPKRMVRAWKDAKNLKEWAPIVSSANIINNHLNNNTNVKQAFKTSVKQAFKSLQDYSQKRIKALRKELKRYPKALTRFLGLWIKSNPENRLLLMIDQGEELVTQVFDEEERQRFLENLEDALAKFPQQLRCVLTLRLDFEPLVETLLPKSLKVDWAKEKRFIVPPMSQDELRDAIEKPALEKALYFEPPKLVDMLINEVVQMPGALPLLSFALSELYIRCSDRWERNEQKRVNRALTEEDYNDLQGVVGSLRRRANQEFDDFFNEAERKTMRNVMLRMVAMEGGELARRRVSTSELKYTNADENDRVTKVVDHFVKQRLFVAGITTESEYIEPAHDALVRGWEKVTAWLDERQEIQSIKLNRSQKLWKKLKSSFSLKRKALISSKIYQEDRQHNTNVNQKSKVSLSLRQELNLAAKKWATTQEISKRDALNWLWDDDPRLGLVRQECEWENNWLNVQESNFINSSITRKSTKRRQTKLITSLVFLVLSCLTFLGFYLFRQSEIRRIDGLAVTSRALLLSEQFVDAEINAIAAMGLSQSVWVQFPIKSKFGSVQSVLLDVIRENFELNRLFHEGVVESVAFSPDGKRIVGGSQDNTVRVWDSTGAPIGEPFEGHINFVTDVAFSPNGKRIVSASWDSTVRVWDASSGQPLGIFKDPDENEYTTGETQFNSVAFSADGKRIISFGDYRVKIWDAYTGELISKPPFNSQLRFLSSSDGKHVLTLSKSSMYQVWDVRTKRPIGQPFKFDTYKEIAALSSDGKLLVYGENKKTFSLWDINDGEFIDDPFKGHEAPISSVAFSSDGKLIASGSETGAVLVWDTSTGQPIGKPFKGHEKGVASLAFSPDSKRLISGGMDSSVRIFRVGDASTGKPIGKLFNVHGDYVRWVKFSPDGKRIISSNRSVNNSGTVQVRDASTGQLIAPSFNVQDDYVISKVFSPDGQRVIGGSSENTVQVWDPITRQAIGKPFEFQDNVFYLKFSLDGKRIISGSSDIVQGWDASTGQPIGKSIELTENIFGDPLAFSSDGKLFATGSEEGAVRVWDTSTGKSMSKHLLDYPGKIDSLAFSPNSKRIAHGNKGGTISVWDSSTGKLISPPFKGHQNKKQENQEINSLAFSLDGKRIISGGLDSTVRVWDSRTGKPIGQPFIHKGYVTSVAFNPNGKRIISGTGDGEVWTWDISVEYLLKVACTQLRHHSSLIKPKTDVAKDAEQTCHKYIWKS